MFELPLLTLKLIVVFFITAKRQLIHNKTAQRSTWNQVYDFIVIGAGGSGCVVANRLTEDPNVNVLLLEWGGPQFALTTDISGIVTTFIRGDPQIQFNYYHEPQNNLYIRERGGRLSEPTARIIGGSTSHNAMSYFRAQRRDLVNWVNTYGAKGWSYEEVLPYYLRFENNTDMNIVRNNPGYHGTNGPVQISTTRDVPKILLLTQQIFSELGFKITDINGFNQTGTMIVQTYTNQNGFRSESGNAYVDPNPHPNNLHIVTRARVLRIIFDGLTAVGVEFDRNDSSYKVYVRKEVILSAGAYQTPHILMHSGIGPRNHLQSFGISVLLDLPVGNNYQNHPSIDFISNISRNLINPLPELSINNLILLYFNNSGPLFQFPTLLTYFSTSSNINKEWPNIISVVFVSGDQLVLRLHIGRLKSRGTVRLQSNNPYIPPKIDLNQYSKSLDLENAIQAVEYHLFVMERTSLAQYIRPNSFESVGCPSCPGRYMYECTESIRCYILSETHTVRHPSGTCRMGAVKRNDIVVDPTLKVKHAQNLRICDASIIPELPNSGTTAEALMIGEKCSQLIKDCYGIS